MRRLSHTLGRVLVLTLALLSSAAPAHAEETPRGEPSWVPSFGLGVLAHTQGAKGSGTTVWPACTPTFPESECFGGRPEARGNPQFLAGVMDLRVGLMGPRIEPVSERVRPFMHAGWQYGWMLFDFEEPVAAEGRLGQILVPTLDDNPDNIDGLGADAIGEIRNGWFAGLGLAIDLPVDGYEFRLMPSIDYYGQQVHLSAVSRRAAEKVRDIPPPPVFPDPPDLSRRAEFRFEETRGDGDDILHALGPRIALEVDIARVNSSLVVSGFAEFGAFWFLGDPEVRIRTTGEGSGDFVLEMDSVAFQGGAGLRFSWRPDPTHE